jgi:hypothetical protein
VGVDDLASQGIEERFLDFADRRLRRSEGGRNNRSAPLGMTVLSGVGRIERGWKDWAGFEKRVF